MRSKKIDDIKDRDPNTKLINKKMGRRSKRKGAQGEREFAKFLKHRGFEARRGRQFSGGDDSPDVVCEDLDFLHFEVKRVEKLNIYSAINQSVKDAGINKIPCVAHRKNSCSWLLTMTMFDFINIIQCMMGREDELNSAWSKLNERFDVGERGRNREELDDSEVTQSIERRDEEIPSDSDLL